jgi:hypothetical protein
MDRPGTCRWCGCTYDEPCPESCGWANAAQTLCTACVNVDREWRQQKTRRANMRRAFFRGYMVGSDDERAEVSSARAWRAQDAQQNPYSKGAAQRGWWAARLHRRHGGGMTQRCAVKWCIALAANDGDRCAVHRLPEYRDLHPELLAADEELTDAWPWEKCDACRGSGKCEECAGTGEVEHQCSCGVDCTHDCAECEDASGRCRACHGFGRSGFRKKAVA